MEYMITNSHSNVTEFLTFSWVIFLVLHMQSNHEKHKKNRWLIWKSYIYTWAVGTMLKESLWKCRICLAISRTAVEPPESTDPDINIVRTPPIKIKVSAKSVHNNLDFPGNKKLNYWTVTIHSLERNCCLPEFFSLLITFCLAGKWYLSKCQGIVRRSELRDYLLSLFRDYYLHAKILKLELMLMLIYQILSKYVLATTTTHLNSFPILNCHITHVTTTEWLTRSCFLTKFVILRRFFGLW